MYQAIKIPLHWEATIPKAKRQKIDRVKAARWILHHWSEAITLLISQVTWPICVQWTHRVNLMLTFSESVPCLNGYQWTIFLFPHYFALPIVSSQKTVGSSMSRDTVTGGHRLQFPHNTSISPPTDDPHLMNSWHKLLLGRRNVCLFTRDTHKPGGCALLGSGTNLAGSS